MYNFFTFLFYMMGLVAVLYEFWKVYNHASLVEISRKMDSKEKLSASENELCFMMLVYYLWVMVGLFSSQWFLFLFILILSVINMIIKGATWSKIDSFLSIITIIFIILNKYHLHYKLSDFL